MSYTEINVHSQEKYVSIWLTKEEAADETMHDKLTPFCQYWKSKKYRVVVFRSGNQNLAEQTKDLLSHAKRVAAEREQGLA